MPDLAQGDWVLLGACRDQPPDLFFPERGEETSPARQVCAGCLVRRECLEYALRERINHGVWGGKSSRERKQMRGYKAA